MWVLPQGSWGPGKDKYSEELLPLLANCKRKRTKEKRRVGGSGDSLDTLLSKKDPTEQQEPDAVKHEGVGSEPVLIVSGFESQLLPLKDPQDEEKYGARQNSLSDPPSNYDEGCVSDLGTLNSTSSRASGPRLGRGRIPGLWTEGVGAEVCSITSDYSTTSSMTFLTGAESSALSPAHDADDERSELVSEGRTVDSDTESNLSVFTPLKKEDDGRDRLCVPEGGVTAPLQSSPGLLIAQRIVAGDTLARKRGSRQKTDSESSSDKDSQTNAAESEQLWRIKMTDRLKCRLRSSADDMFGSASQRTRSPETRARRKANIRRRHTMGGQRDFAELSVITGNELSAMDRLKPKCSSQDFSISDWIARERHRASNPEVGTAATAAELFCSLNGAVVAHGKGFSLADAHPHKLSGTQVVRSRFYQYL